MSKWLHRVRSWIVHTVWRRRFERELNDELERHFEQVRTAHVDAGSDSTTATREAERSLGGPLVRVKEEVRDHVGLTYLDDLRRDIVHGMRVLARNAGFTAVALTTLGLAIGFGVATFAAIDAWLLKPLAFPAPDQLVVGLYATQERPAEPAMFVLHRDFDGWRGRTPSFSAMAGMFPREYLVDGRPQAQTADGLIVTGEFFSVLGVPPLLGRTLTASDATGAPVVVISDGLWDRRFARSPSALGSTLSLNGVSHEVVGIMPRGFEVRLLDHVRGFDLWTPLRETDKAGGKGGVAILGRLRAAVSAEQGQRELAALHQETEASFTPNAARFPILLNSLQADYARLIRPTLLTCAAGVVALLLIAATTVGTLLIGLGMGRTQEVAVRAAIGGGRGRLLRQFLAEGLLLSGLAGICGLLVTQAAIAALEAWNPFEMAPATPMRLDLRAGAVALAATAVTSVVCGLVPALRLAATEPIGAIRAGGRAASRPGARRAQTALLVFQVATSVVVLVATLLLGRSFQRLQSAPLGFTVDGVTTVSLALPAQEYDEAGRRLAFYGALEAQLLGMPAVQHVSASTALPLSAGSPAAIHLNDDPLAAILTARAQEVTAGLFETLEMTMAAGRGFTHEDTATSRPVVVLNERAAAQFFETVHAALGQRLRVGDDVWREVVGVTRNTQAGTYNSMAWVTDAKVYVPLEQSAGAVRSPTVGYRPLHIHLRADTSLSHEYLRELIASASPAVAVTAITQVSDELRRATKQPAVRMMMLGAFGAMSLFLATLGIYGLVAQGVTQQARELGIRQALGASSQRMLWRVTGHAAAVGTGGVFIGVAVALWLAASLQPVLYGIEARDFASFSTAAALLMAVSAVAALVPARRVFHLNLAEILRRD